MTTKTSANHKQFFALVKNLGIEDYKSFLFDYTSGQTDSLSELMQVYPQTYNALLQQLQSMCTSINTCAKLRKMDKWRKRLIASIFAWAESIDEPMHLNKVKAIACKASGYDGFNDIPQQRLQSLYNAFLKMAKDMKAVEEVTKDLLSNLNANIRLEERKQPNKLN